MYINIHIIDLIFLSLTKMFSYVCSYYIDRRVTKVEDFLKTRLLDTLSEQINKVLKVRFSLF